jgi:hypothetical protein
LQNDFRGDLAGKTALRLSSRSINTTAEIAERVHGVER